MSTKNKTQLSSAGVRYLIIGIIFAWSVLVLSVGLLAYAIREAELSQKVCGFVVNAVVAIGAFVGAMLSVRNMEKPGGGMILLFCAIFILMLLLVDVVILNGVARIIWTRVICILFGGTTALAYCMRKGPRKGYKKKRFC